MNPKLKEVNCHLPSEVSRLYERLRPFALSKTQYLTGDFLAAQDIVQDVFEGLLVKPLVFADELQAYQWIYRCCHNRGIDFLRCKKRRLEILNKSKFEFIPIPKTPQDRIENQQILAKYVNKFDARQAEILGFIVVDGMTHGEIAQMLEVSTKTVQRTWLQIQEIVSRLRGTNE